MRWTVRSARTIYRDQWLQLRSADVEVSEGHHLDHRIVASANSASLVAVVDRQVLLLWRHRFITDAWGWEVPGGAINRGEDPARAAVRELHEETGWRATGEPRALLEVHPMPGLCTARHQVFQTDSVEYTGPPVDGFESDRIAWVPLADVAQLIRKGDIVEGTTLASLLKLVSGV